MYGYRSRTLKQVKHQRCISAKISRNVARCLSLLSRGKFEWEDSHLMYVLVWFLVEISKVELHVKENNKEHRTDDVTVKRLMVRRGQSFKITLKTNRQFQPDTDTLIFTAETGMFMYHHSLYIIILIIIGISHTKNTVHSTLSKCVDSDAYYNFLIHVFISLYASTFKLPLHNTSHTNEKCNVYDWTKCDLKGQVILYSKTLPTSWICSVMNRQ